MHVATHVATTIAAAAQAVANLRALYVESASPEVKAIVARTLAQLASLPEETSFLAPSTSRSPTTGR